MTANQWLDHAANKIARVCSHPYTMAGALGASVGWLAGGPLANWSPAYLAWMQNTTGLVTFDLAFIILAAGARDVAALHLKLDEALHALNAARNALIGAEEMATDDIRAEAEALRKARNT